MPKTVFYQADEVSAEDATDNPLAAKIYDHQQQARAKRPRPRRFTFTYRDLALLLGRKEQSLRAAKSRGDFDPHDFESVVRYCVRQRLDLLRPLDWDEHEMLYEFRLDVAPHVCTRCGLSWRPGIRTIGKCKLGYVRGQAIPGRTIDV